MDTEAECRSCQRGDDLQAAHISYRRFDSGLIDPNGIVPLCVECHMAYDAHKLDLLPYINYAEQAKVVADLGIVRAYKRLTGESIMESDLDG